MPKEPPDGDASQDHPPIRVVRENSNDLAERGPRTAYLAAARAGRHLLRVAGGAGKSFEIGGSDAENR